MKALSVFLPYVIPHATACSDPMAESAVLSACIEFCERTLLIQNTSSETSVAGQSDYDIEVPSGLQHYKTLAVYYNTRKLRARSMENVSHAIAVRGEAINGETITNGTPTEWFSRSITIPTVSIYPPPDSAVTGGVTIKAAFVPTRTATTVPDILFDVYVTTIANGAVSRLLSTNGQPFANAPMALQFRREFDSVVSRAATIARQGTAAVASRVSHRPFA